MKALVFVTFSLFLLNNCTTSSPNKSQVSSVVPTVPQDQVYLAAYEAASQSAEIYANFETLLQARVTYLSPAFMKAYETREQALQLIPLHAFGTLTHKIGFLVSLFTPNDTAERFADNTYWSITLQVGEQTYKRTLLLPQREKLRLQSFFPHISSWSKEFLLVFTPDDLTSTPKQSHAPLRLSLHHPQAGVILTWDQSNKLQ